MHLPGFLGPILANVQESFEALVELIHQRQVVVATTILDLVDPNRFDAR